MAPQPMYRIVDWAEKFEASQSKRCFRPTWFKQEHEMSSAGYTALLDHANGAAHLGVWTALKCIASQSKPRGVLVNDNGKPHDATSMARMSRIPANTLNEAITRLIEIGWLEEMTADQVQKQAECPFPAAVPREPTAQAEPLSEDLTEALCDLLNKYKSTLSGKVRREAGEMLQEGRSEKDLLAELAEAKRDGKVDTWDAFKAFHRRRDWNKGDAAVERAGEAEACKLEVY